MSTTATIDIEVPRTVQASSTMREPRTESVGACPLCGALDSRVAFRARDRFCGTPGEFTYRCCNGCNTVFQDPKVIREDIALCYPERYYTHERDADAAEQSAGRLRELRDLVRKATRAAVQRKPSPLALYLLGKLAALSSRMRARAFNDLVDELIPRWPAGLRALEIGCGSGQLLVKLQSAGWEVEGVERDQTAAEIARAQSGRRVWEGDFVEVSLPSGAYHLVVMSHVFEHLDDPIAALTRIRQLLAPGGRAVLFYPNPQSAGARAFGNAWLHWDPPRHLVLPPPGSLAKAADRAGLRTIQWRTRTGASVSYFARTESPGVPSLRSGASRAGRAVAALARLLIGFGFGVGEEAIIVVQRDDAGDSQ